MICSGDREVEEEVVDIVAGEAAEEVLGEAAAEDDEDEDEPRRKIWKKKLRLGTAPVSSVIELFREWDP